MDNLKITVDDYLNKIFISAPKYHYTDEIRFGIESFATICKNELIEFYYHQLMDGIIEKYNSINPSHHINYNITDRLKYSLPFKYKDIKELHFSYSHGAICLTIYYINNNETTIKCDTIKDII